MVTGVAMMSRWAALAAAVAAGLLAVDSDTASGSASGAAPAPDDRPNIVLVLMDDASMDLVQTMTSAAGCAGRVRQYRKSFVVDSLCCVSRAVCSPASTPIRHGCGTNTANLPNPVGPMGGWEAFRSYGNPSRSFNVRLQASGYRTALIGKYLNEYEGDRTRYCRRWSRAGATSARSSDRPTTSGTSGGAGHSTVGPLQTVHVSRSAIHRRAFGQGPGVRRLG